MPTLPVDGLNQMFIMHKFSCCLQDAAVPVLWCSKLQTEITLSTTEAEYIALIQAMRKVVPFMTSKYIIWMVT